MSSSHVGVDVRLSVELISKLDEIAAKAELSKDQLISAILALSLYGQPEQQKPNKSPIHVEITGEDSPGKSALYSSIINFLDSMGAIVIDHGPGCPYVANDTDLQGRNVFVKIDNTPF